MAEEKDEEGGHTRFFSGADEAEYRDSWRKWVVGYLRGLPSTVSKTSSGPKISNLLKGEASRLCKHLEIPEDSDYETDDEEYNQNSLYVVGGHKKIFAILHKRSPKQARIDEWGDTLDEWTDAVLEKKKKPSKSRPLSHMDREQIQKTCRRYGLGRTWNDLLVMLNQVNSASSGKLFDKTNE